MRHLFKGPVHVICFKVVGSPLSFIVWTEVLLKLILLLHLGCLQPFTLLHLFYLLVLLPRLDYMNVALCVLFHEAALDELVEILLKELTWAALSRWACSSLSIFYIFSSFYSISNLYYASILFYSLISAFVLRLFDPAFMRL